MGKGPRTLKSALSSQQNRLKMRDRASQAAQLADKRTKQPATNKGKGRATQTRPTIPFCATDRILLVGEGNFSFARALIQMKDASSPDGTESDLAFLPPQNVTATSYDSEDECYAKYPSSREIVESLRGSGVEVYFGVDATRLEGYGGFKGRRWDRVVWNFPHAGKGITDRDRNILANQVLMIGFLRSVARFLEGGSVPVVQKRTGKKKKRADDDDDDDDDEVIPGRETGSTTSARTRGTVLITLRNVPPYTLWDISKLAKNPPPPSPTIPQNPRYIQLRSFAFHRDIWKGYEHRMTKGERANGTGKTGEGGEDRTWEFCLRD